jgi:hypothetical protein
MSETSNSDERTVDDLTAGERALCRASYHTSFDEMDDWKQEQFLRILDDMPERLRAGLDNEIVSKKQLKRGMGEVFEGMVEQEDMPKEWKDGAAVFAKGMEKKFGLGDVNDE